MNNSRFRAFLPDGLQGKRDFYGSGSTFVFSVSKYIKIYKSTGKIQFFVSCLPRAFIVCASYIEKGNIFGSVVYLGSNIDNGHSSSCPTFDWPLLSGETEFLIASIELWHLIPRNPNL
jgi:hypothetical protein